jgi:hypothetical protein
MNNNICKQVRSYLCGIIADKLIFNKKWVNNHIAKCPRCQNRLAAFGRVESALSIMKSQPHNLDLVLRANNKTICALKKSLRQLPRAQKLATMYPEPTLFERCKVYKNTAVNIAACITILFLMKIGVFSAFDTFQTKGKEAIKQYYTRNVGEDLTKEIFNA